MLENKGIEKDRFSGPKCSTGRGYSQLAQLVEEPIDRLPSSGQGPVEGCQKLYLSPSGLLFQVEVILFPARSGRGLVEVRSRTGRGPIEVMVTCHALNAPRLVNRSTPSSTDRGYFLLFLTPELRNL